MNAFRFRQWLTLNFFPREKKKKVGNGDGGEIRQRESQKRRTSSGSPVKGRNWREIGKKSNGEKK